MINFLSNLKNVLFNLSALLHAGMEIFMKRNEFGEIEKPRNKVNILIFCVAIAAIIITGVLYAVKLSASTDELQVGIEQSIDYEWQNNNENI